MKKFEEVVESVFQDEGYNTQFTPVNETWLGTIEDTNHLSYKKSDINEGCYYGIYSRPCS